MSKGCTEKETEHRRRRMKGKAASENGWTLGEALLKFKAAVTEPSATAEAKREGERERSIREYTQCVSVRE